MGCFDGGLRAVQFCSSDLDTILLVRPRYNFARSSQNHSVGEDKITWSVGDSAGEDKITRPAEDRSGLTEDHSAGEESSCADRVSAPLTSIQSAKADHSVVGWIVPRSAHCSIRSAAICTTRSVAEKSSFFNSFIVQFPNSLNAKLPAPSTAAF